jgi:ribosome biogenesis protein NSA1
MLSIQIRIYDSKAARRPVFDKQIGEHPIRSLCVVPNKSEIIFGDTVGNMIQVDLRTGNELGRFKSFSGSVTDVQIVHDGKSSKVISCSLDRYLRVHTLVTRKLETKLYLKQRLNCSVFLEPPVTSEGKLHVTGGG